MTEVSVDGVGRWVITQYDVIALENWVGNHLSLPKKTIPQTLMELEWAQALAIEEIRGRKIDLDKEMSISGKVVDVDWAAEIKALERVVRNEKEAMAILLDGWEPVEVVSISDLATVVCPVGIIAPNTKSSAEVALDLGLDKPQKMIVPVDEIVVLPVPAGQKVKLKMKLNRDLRLSRKTTVSIEIIAGQMGIILDLRGRPILLPGLDGGGRQRVKRWREAIWGASG